MVDKHTPEKMNDKLVLRAAAKYRNWLISRSRYNRQEILERIVNLTNKVTNNSQQMHKWSNSLLLSASDKNRIVGKESENPMIERLISDTGRDINGYVDHLIRLLGELVDLPIISMTNSTQEINAIVHSWEQVKYRGGILSVLISKINLSDGEETVFLGSFWAEVDLNDIDSELHIVSVDEIESNDGYYHPHVSDQELCAGEGVDLMIDAISQGRLEDYFRIIEAILRTYNENSPHNHLSEWYGSSHKGRFFCGYCEEWRNDESLYYCSKCGFEYCEYCNSDGDCCAECNEWYCGECLTACHSCQNTLCGRCEVFCSSCENTICSECREECSHCEECICGECSNSCCKCADNVCGDCSAECGCCGETYCSPCCENLCKDCNVEICCDCLNKCSDCKKTICEDCKENNSCDSCGVEVCASCNTKHNCILEKVKN